MIKISLMTIDDYDDVYKLWTNTSGMGLRTIDDSFQGINQFLQRNPNTNFLAVADDQIVGVILCGHDGRRACIYHMAVRENYRGRGIGKVLVEAVLTALRQEEITKASLFAFATNENGNRFWQSMGFTAPKNLVYRTISLNNDNVERRIL